MKGSGRLLVAAMLCAVAARAQNPPPPPAPPPRAAPSQPAPAPSREGEPDDGLLEFLGSDDVGDAAWWDFLKKRSPRGNDPAPPPDARK